MPRKNNLTNKKFEKLTVIKDSGKRSSSRSIIWECQCDCGNICYVDTNSLTRKDGKNTKSCGCIKKSSDLTGQRFNQLTVIASDGKDKYGHPKWLCQCDCGNTLSVITHDLTRKDGKAIISCGCNRAINEIGKRYGNLTVIDKDIQKTKQHSNGVYWKCQCDCGNIVSVLGRNLRDGFSTSCGCVKKSKGEQKITEILKLNNINFCSQYSFSDLVSLKNYKLYFDFAILKNNEVVALIEYQGKQHYEVGFNMSQSEFEESLGRDQLKRDYCIKNNIPLIEISYLEFDKINTNYILNKLKGII